MFFYKGDFWAKSQEKSGLKQKLVKNCENSVFRVIYVKEEEKSLGSGPFHRDGRVTGNKHLFF